MQTGHWRLTISAFTLLCACLSSFRVGAATPEPISDAAVMQILQDRIQRDHRGVGMVVGILTPQASRILSYGRARNPDGAPLDGDSLFEIGSISKVFTSLLLADMVSKGERKLDDPLTVCLADAKLVPTRAGRSITFLDLATHRSGLPRMPNNFAPADARNPYADYDSTQLMSFLAHYQLPRDIGSQFEYSNLGAGLLGHLLSRCGQQTYETLVRTRILNVLDMQDTVITLNANQRARLATGHDQALQPVANWDFDVLAGAGGWRASTKDLLRFLRANLTLPHTSSPSPSASLAASMAMTHQVRNDAGRPGSEIGLGWHILHQYGRDLVWHNGGTGGYRSFIGFNQQEQRAVVVLANTTHDIDDIGRHLLASAFPLTTQAPAKVYQAIALSSEQFSAYLGSYQLAPNFYLALSTEQGRLYGQATGQPRFEIFASSTSEFFARVVDAQITMVKDAEGRVLHLVLHQNGQHLQAPKQ